MKTIRTKEELEIAIKNGERKFLCQGVLGETLKQVLEREQKKKKTATVLGSLAVIGGIAAIPFTGGVSAIGAAAAIGLTIGALTISLGELALILGAALAAYGISKNRKVKLKMAPNGVELEIK